MIPNKPWIEINDRDTQRLRKEFGGDKRIHYGFNKKTRAFEAWYVPSNSRPYMITNAMGIDHAVKLLRGRAKYDKMRACDMIREIDEHNDTIMDDKREDAVREIRSQLKDAVNGKQYFGPWSNRSSKILN